MFFVCSNLHCFVCWLKVLLNFWEMYFQIGLTERKAGVAFVEMCSGRGARDAKEFLNGTTLFGRVLEINLVIFFIFF